MDKVYQMQEIESPFSTILGKKSTQIHLAFMTVVWISASFCYYLISFELKYLHGDIFKNAVTSCFSELIAIMLSGIMLDTLGFKQTLNVSYIIAFTGMLFLLVT